MSRGLLVMLVHKKSRRRTCARSRCTTNRRRSWFSSSCATSGDALHRARIHWVLATTCSRRNVSRASRAGGSGECAKYQQWA
eukprot:5115999-Lingulodinium_polyedra.AAC.1